ncbi:hypothetical protein [Arthrobacter bambusae]|uniref:hypothetical protein n=1 Tax=Arthrobacter bambusae TaxID=1338426 RepID=UPI00278892EB|nr:hypothetical protein [Arthrobacter bambusae]MDQ0241190.1 putative tellurium resistance membrane protein TerC [Arthrobacter bambusae]
MKYWQKHLLLFALLVAAVVWLVDGTGLSLTWGQAFLLWIIIELHRRGAVLAERHDVARRAKREQSPHYSDSGQEK